MAQRSANSRWWPGLCLDASSVVSCGSSVSTPPPRSPGVCSVSSHTLRSPSVTYVVIFSTEFTQLVLQIFFPHQFLFFPLFSSQSFPFLPHLSSLPPSLPPPLEEIDWVIWLGASVGGVTTSRDNNIWSIGRIGTDGGMKKRVVFGAASDDL